MRRACPQSVGTITLDSYTRVGDYRSALSCLADGDPLNGYPIVTHSVATTRDMLAKAGSPAYPVQLRHGTSRPEQVFDRLIEVGLEATEGGPVSYCLPYGNVPLEEATKSWSRAVRLLAEQVPNAHVESFGGCLMGQLCPPSVLVVVSLLECLFFKEWGIRSVSLSYAQGPSASQDRAAIRVLRELASVHLLDVDWHIVLYTYMGVFPASDEGASALIADSARLARQARCERLVVKTRSESWRIPSIEENVDALRLASEVAMQCQIQQEQLDEETQSYEEIKEEAYQLIESILCLDSSIARSLILSFRRGLLDVPYCLHSDNHGKARSAIDDRGHISWTTTGNLQLGKNTRRMAHKKSSVSFLEQLSYVARRYDSQANRS